jgi:hypothetical protein
LRPSLEEGERAVGVAVAKQILNRQVSTLPYRNGARSNLLSLGISVIRRARPSVGSAMILSGELPRKGLRAAVKVV